jgi:hypothetical protein
MSDDQDASPSIAAQVRQRWESDLTKDVAAAQETAQEARQLAIDAGPAWYTQIPRPSLLAVVGTAHAVLVAVTFFYVLTTFGTIWALGISVAYTLVWTVVLTNRADERGRLSRTPAPFRRYVPPKDEDLD